MTDPRMSRLRVDVPTLEPDPAFLAMLSHLGATSRPATPRSARSGGLRMIVATGSIAAIAAATWAAGVPTAGETPLSPADSPVQHGPSAPSSPGEVGTPLSDVTASPGSPKSPGLPGNSSSSSDDAARGTDTAREFRPDDVQPRSEASDGTPNRVKGKKSPRATRQGKSAAKNSSATRKADRTSHSKSDRPGRWSTGKGPGHGKSARGTRGDDRGRGHSSSRRDDRGSRGGKQHRDRGERSPGFGFSGSWRFPHQH